MGGGEGGEVIVSLTIFQFVFRWAKPFVVRVEAK
jgi:hypothetical protein